VITPPDAQESFWLLLQEIGDPFKLGSMRSFS
jgi:hypothetical protein